MIRSAEPIGYVLQYAGDKVIAAVDLNGLSHWRLLVPRAPPERAASVAAMLMLALVWDPGDVG
ncbi:MAG: hypothetical protein EOP89_16170 [Lysobacteraceae bacterium]|nr:MAG: hypothetical protein EOP89_16170 [Xanthomonadaceae bacterium]